MTAEGRPGGPPFFMRRIRQDALSRRW
ncbi:hypothetical protein R2601_02958 [Salipiger bermudensis HTCC2601]|uniref:Uncharacterized protein n=1 Tax=Salipiger bermudensis (strain DSM 26914 / JCM 13377 / KCTC 12554 / HTCC2601) TaxID=314265 RepID=Q0FWQ4_SALBH|nr:hypothetical protein R2601_02958 [Salipiger bermudensis HTCC2601]